MSHTSETVSALQARFGAAIQSVEEFHGDTTVTVARDALLEALQHLKATPALGFNFLATISVYDDWPAEPRFNVIYQLRELTHPTNLRLRVRVPGDDPVLPTATGVFVNANWYEREVWDMFGIQFTGHPDPRRILMPEDWQGHPLRKDYPLGYEEVQFTFNQAEIDQKKPYAQE
ncbi:MAG: NADH-quinone oxidoreductase subunit C [Anaerolineales bacterium]|nr:NADH-quinone oxidoreductase subunit C [Anaerolineales bacterium]